MHMIRRTTNASISIRIVVVTRRGFPIASRADHPATFPRIPAINAHGAK
jgi:hypothetical protein